MPGQIFPHPNAVVQQAPALAAALLAAVHPLLQAAAPPAVVHLHLAAHQALARLPQAVPVVFKLQAVATPCVALIWKHVKPS